MTDGLAITLTALGILFALGVIAVIIDLYARIAAHRQEFRDILAHDRKTSDALAEHARRITSLEQTREFLRDNVPSALNALRDIWRQR